MSNIVKSINHIRVAAINVNSIVTHHRRFELLQFLKDYNHDVIFISETKLNPRHKLTFKDYELVRRDRPNAAQGGGTAILIKKDLPFEETCLPSVPRNEILECTVKVPTNNNSTIVLVSVYARGDSRCLFMDELDDLFRGLELDRNDVFYIVAGDLNARHKDWGGPINNQRGRHLKRWEAANGCEFKLKIISPVSLTFKGTLTFLDLCLADSRLNHIDSVGGKSLTIPYDSDHAAISLAFEIGSISVSLRDLNAGGHHYNFKATRWDKFSQGLD